MSSIGLAKLRKHGAALFKEMMRRDYDYGGAVVALLGPQGTGKTTLLYQLGIEALRRGDLVLVTGRHPHEQIQKLPEWEKRVVVWKYYRDILKFYKVRNHKKEDITQRVDIRDYKSPTDLLERLEPEKLNLVYGATVYKMSDDVQNALRIKHNIVLPADEQIGGEALFWRELLYYAKNRIDDGWLTILMDEADDYLSFTTTGINYYLNDLVKDAVKDFRKTRTNLYFAVHRLSDMHWQITSKIMFYILLRGARVPKGISHIDQSVVNKLDIGTAMIVRDARFGIFEFEPLLKPDYVVGVLLKGKPIQVKTEEKRVSYIQQVKEVLDTLGPAQAELFVRRLHSTGKISRWHVERIISELGLRDG